MRRAEEKLSSAAVFFGLISLVILFNIYMATSSHKSARSIPRVRP
jgi:hypothetical protein